MTPRTNTPAETGVAAPGAGAPAPEGRSELPRDPGSERKPERVDRVPATREPAVLPRAAGQPAVPVDAPASSVESEHLLRSLARDDHVDGLPGRPMLPRRSRGAHLHREHRTNEELIAHRVRRLTNQSPTAGRGNPASRPLPRSVDRAPMRSMWSAPVVNGPTVAPVEGSRGSAAPSASDVFDQGSLPRSPDHVDAATDG